MVARCGNGNRELLSQIKRANESQQHLSDDLRSASGAGGQHGLASGVQDDRRTHARQGSLAGGDGIVLGADQTKRVGNPRLAREIIHLVVQHNAGPRHNHFRSERRVDRGGDRNPVAGRIGGRDVGRVTAKQCLLGTWRIAVSRDLAHPIGLDPLGQCLGVRFVDQAERHVSEVRVS